ncbi:MAG: DUF115 domain-containing protein [Methanobacteriaceae archaeon]|jgi:uncharacterized Rossmann fold enzyme|nr:DUF115 domain-containing protein [Candidatus Methanorudis spinitermitis]
MKFNQWELFYKQILDDFGFSKKTDEESANLLSIILKSQGSTKLENLLFNLPTKKIATKNFIVFGAGPSLKFSIKHIKKNLNIENYILIAADGATTGLLEEKITPDIVVTDLDGKLEDLLIANDLKSFFVIHAHGNNKEEIIKYTPKFKKVLGTTQSKPIANLYNFGGFTDGDRAVFLAIALGAKKILLGGMDFGKFVTNYSRPDMNVKVTIADEIKQKKLKYAEQLIEWIKNNENVDIINIRK